MENMNFQFKQVLQQDDLLDLQENTEINLSNIVKDFWGERGLANPSIKAYADSPASTIVKIPKGAGYVKVIEDLYGNGNVAKILRCAWETELSVDTNTHGEVATRPASGYSRYISAFIRFKRTGIDERTNYYGDNIYYKLLEDYDVIITLGNEVLDGDITEADKPDIQDGDILLFDVLLDSGSYGEITDAVDESAPTAYEIDTRRAEYFSNYSILGTAGNIVTIDSSNQPQDSGTALTDIATLADVAAEQTERIAQDAALSDSIVNEYNNRVAVDQSLDQKINNEEVARTDADNVLQSAINAEATTRATAVSAEETARIAADNAHAALNTTADGAHGVTQGAGGGFDADTLDGQEGSYYQDASNINAGTLDSARLPDDISASFFEHTGDIQYIKELNNFLCGYDPDVNKPYPMTSIGDGLFLIAIKQTSVSSYRFMVYTRFGTQKAAFQYSTSANENALSVVYLGKVGENKRILTLMESGQYRIDDFDGSTFTSVIGSTAIPSISGILDGHRAALLTTDTVAIFSALNDTLTAYTVNNTTGALTIVGNITNSGCDGKTLAFYKNNVVVSGGYKYTWDGSFFTRSSFSAHGEAIAVLSERYIAIQNFSESKINIYDVIDGEIYESYELSAVAPFDGMCALDSRRFVFMDGASDTVRIFERSVANKEPVAALLG